MKVLKIVLGLALVYSVSMAGAAEAKAKVDAKVQAEAMKRQQEEKAKEITEKYQYTAGSYDANATEVTESSYDESKGFNEDGSCDGEIYIFDGNAKGCLSAWRGPETLYGSIHNCCNGNSWSSMSGHCKSHDPSDGQKYAESIDDKNRGVCVTLGDYCKHKGKKGFLAGGGSYCKREWQTSCCFSTKLARIINQQGRAQIGKGWGTPANPDCSGFTTVQFQKLDFSKINLDEYFDDVMTNINIEGVTDSIDVDTVKDKVVDKYKNMQN